jgi:dihydrofolate reductase
VAAQISERARMPSISFIVARSYPGNVIGYKNALPWHLGSDLKRFREITTGHVIIMGLNTHVSISTTLPKRINIVLTQSRMISNTSAIDVDAETQLIFTNTLEETLFAADIISICRGKNDIFVIGGQNMFELFRKFVNKVYLTQVSADVKGDAFFDMKFEPKEWRTIEEIPVTKSEGTDDYNYLFSILSRRERKNRYAFVKDFLTELDSKKLWLASNINKHRGAIVNYIHENLELDF